MTQTFELIKAIAGLSGNELDLRSYNINETLILAGMPPLPIKGIHYVFANHIVPQTKRITGFNGNSIFLKNRNIAGIVEIALLSDSPSCAALQIYDYLGVPFPIFGFDKSTAAMSFFAATACLRVGTPEFRREGGAGISVFTFETNKLFMQQGTRLLQNPDDIG